MTTSHTVKVEGRRRIERYTPAEELTCEECDATAEWVSEDSGGTLCRAHYQAALCRVLDSGGADEAQKFFGGRRGEVQKAGQLYDELAAEPMGEGGLSGLEPQGEGGGREEGAPIHQGTEEGGR